MGINIAFEEACIQSSILIKAGIPVFCPIAHAHPIAVNGHIDPYDHKIWIPADKPFMEQACGLIFCKLASWEISTGMRIEREFFEAAGKPVIDMTPGVVPTLPI